MPKTVPWTVKDIPSQSGKVAIITGATGGLGYEMALALAQAGAKVIVAGRSDTKGEAALEKIKAICPTAQVTFGKIDLCSLASVSEFAKDFLAKGEALDILINNAGVMMPPKREVTSDGFELQLGTNHLAHFALTAQLLPALRKSSAPRVVNLSSSLSNQGKINFDDLQYEKTKYGLIPTYAQSKLANLLFTFEMQRRSDAGEWGVKVYAAHPGFSRTDLIANNVGSTSFFGRVTGMVRPMFSQSAADGALSAIFAATSPDAKDGMYYGPQGFMEMKGSVGPADVPKNAKDLDVAKRFWDVSVELTKVVWP